ncbi:Molybdenum cofactor guanylyltransferase [Rhodobacteraceae bacterium SB2]|nr:molybdenum cofactor guanylyltransferase MobA [Paracoccaceae bacterium]OAH08911.1 Molybdenum cofactor guanylyltransferase [Rhodobacteraceae bacterium SB2]
MTQAVGVILAGGQARRMGGGDKGRLLLEKKSLFQHVINRLAPQVDRIVLNANGNPDRFKDLALPVITDNFGDHAGPLAGVLAGLDWAHQQGADHIVTVAADTPFFPKGLVDALFHASQGQEHKLVLAASQHGQDKPQRHPTFGLWPVALAEDLRKELREGLRKVVRWSDQHEGRIALFSAMPFDPFFNINTPQDLQNAADFMQYS